MHKHAAQCVCVCVCVCVGVCAYTSTWEWQTLTPLFLYDTAYVEHQRISCRAGSNSLIAMWRKFDWVDIVPIQERNESGKARAEAAAQALGQTICNGRYKRKKMKRARSGCAGAKEKAVAAIRCEHHGSGLAG